MLHVTFLTLLRALEVNIDLRHVNHIRYYYYNYYYYAPSYLIELVTPVANIPGRASFRSAGRHDLVVPRSRLVSSERAFSVAAPRAWNSLPVDIRLITDTKLFKKKLKTFLFNSAYHGIRQ